jgi:hypothetical protein
LKAFASLSLSFHCGCEAFVDFSFALTVRCFIMFMLLLLLVMVAMHCAVLSIFISFSKCAVVTGGDIIRVEGGKHS